MRKNIKKIICLLLALVAVMSLFAGCAEEQEDEIPVIIPEQQIFDDKYERNDDITNFMTYTVDYISNSGSFLSSVEVITLFDHMKVQVDKMDSVTIGITTMGEIAAIVDKANNDYVTEKTNAVIAKRQAKIDEEYEEAKRKAEEKGDTYDKPKKEVRTDDIHFDEPYSYTVTYGKNKNAITEEYKPTLLMDPSRYKEICFDISKYGIPYVRFEFVYTNGVYNVDITQESDWIVNGVRAADVSSYINQETNSAPEFVDVDGRNKAAKQNIYMSGNIAFGGDGFTWDSLMLLCNALRLSKGAKYHGFVQSSDTQFTYYTISLYTNPFEADPNASTNEKLYVPTTRLIATFDPLTQVCLNWTIDTYSTSSYYQNRTHSLSEPTSVNVHEYQVDTNDYDGMQKSVKEWIAKNAKQTTTKYCAFNFDNKKMFGVVDTGLTNLTIEPIINGVTYYCIDSYVDDKGSTVGTFISLEDMQKAEKMNSRDAENYIDTKSVRLEITCCLLDGDTVLAKIYDITNAMVQSTSGDTYYIVDYEKAAYGYENIRILTNEQIGALLMMYAKTYKLDTTQYSEIQNIFKNDGAIAVKNYINAMAEELKLRQQNQKPTDDAVTEDETAAPEATDSAEQEAVADE
jgi:hypothetical protein